MTEPVVSPVPSVSRCSVVDPETEKDRMKWIIRLDKRQEAEHDGPMTGLTFKNSRLVH